MWVYLAVNSQNNKKYVGLTTKRSAQMRWSEHKHRALVKHCAGPFYSAIRKYGWEAFHFSVIDSASSLEELKQKEKRYIAEHASHWKTGGYNISLGGDGDCSPKSGRMAKGVRGTWITQETKDRIRESTTHRESGCIARQIVAIKGSQVQLFESVQAASRGLSISPMAVVRAARGEVQNPRHGFRIQYAERDEK